METTAAPRGAAAPPGAAGRRAEQGASPRRDLVVLAVVGVLLAGAVWAGFSALYRDFWGPSAFVERYVQLLASGRAADALAVPGVALDATELESAGLPPSSSEAMLRSAALAELSDVRAVAERPHDDVVDVTVAYTADGYKGKTTFTVAKSGWEGMAPSWRFASSPLAVLDVTVQGSMQLEVNGFEIDKRQVSPDGIDADPVAPVQLLVFSPGLYRIDVDTAAATGEDVAVLADAPLSEVPVELQAEPSKRFLTVVQKQVQEFLDQCTQQQVLQPTGCPFGYEVDDRLEDVPQWSIKVEPVVDVVPNGAGWAIPTTPAVAHIEAEVRSIFDGSVDQISEDVPFVFDGTIDMLPDGTASIRIGSGQ